MVKRVVHIENALEILKILYKDIGNGRYKGITDNNTSIKELYANILISGANMLDKTGLYKEYFTHENEELASPKGIINISDSISQQTIFNGKLLCSYDDISENNYLNQIIKASLMAIKNSEDISNEIKLRTSLILKAFNAVDSINIDKIDFNRIRYNNSNFRYKTIIDISKTIYNEEKYSKTKEYTEADRLYYLFKKAYTKIFEKIASKNDTVRIIGIDYDISNNEYDKKIIGSNHEVAIDNSDRAVVIKVIKTQRGSLSSKIYQQNINKLAESVINYEMEYKTKASGVILYVNTDYSVMTCEQLKLVACKERMIGIDTIDLTDPWKYASTKINKIYKTFIENGV